MSTTTDQPHDHTEPELRWAFRDGSELTITPHGVDWEGRQNYAYHLTSPTGDTVQAGDDLRSGVGEPVNLHKALAAWTSFAGADAETYQSTMSGDAMQEWAYQHNDELCELSCDLEEQPGPPAAAGADDTDDTDTGHSDYPHWPGALPDCPGCEDADDTTDGM